jgi:hypothetical protein
MTGRGRKTITEELQVAGGELPERIRGILAEGRVRHLRVRSPTGELYFELPLAAGVIGGAALAVAAPWLAMAGSLAGLVSNVKLEVVREDDTVEAVIEPAGMQAVTGTRKPARLTGKAQSRTGKPAARSAAKRASAGAKGGTNRSAGRGASASGTRRSTRRSRASKPAGR